MIEQMKKILSLIFNLQEYAFHLKCLCTISGFLEKTGNRELNAIVILSIAFCEMKIREIEMIHRVQKSL